MADNRVPRDLESRAVQARPSSWMPPETLPEPDKIPGYDYRWVRISTLNAADPRNFVAKTREGWEPVPPEEQPGYYTPVSNESRDPRAPHGIEIGGLLLCKIPHSFMVQRAQHYAKITHDQMVAVDNNLMRQNDPRMPLFKESKSSHSFGSGT